MDFESFIQAVKLEWSYDPAMRRFDCPIAKKEVLWLLEECYSLGATAFDTAEELWDFYYSQITV